MISLRVPSEPPAARDVVPDQPARIDRTAFVDEIVGRLDRHHGSPASSGATAYSAYIPTHTGLWFDPEGES